jgi:hypothetical protein
MLDGLCPGAIVSNKLVGRSAGLEWWAVLLIARAVGAHGHTKVLVKEKLAALPGLGWLLRLLECPLQVCESPLLNLCALTCTLYCYLLMIEQQ